MKLTRIMPVRQIGDQFPIYSTTPIEVVADRGLNDKVEPQVWQQMVSSMQHAFKQGDFESGLTQAIDQVSALLVQHFPLAAGEKNPNELPDQPLLG